LIIIREYVGQNIGEFLIKFIVKDSPKKPGAKDG
tara:strand:- start:175 stop:276 length:102 start_codon:yes stop_codon:yes gene_type:complete